MGELVMGVPTTFVSEKHGCVVVHRGSNFPSSRMGPDESGWHILTQRSRHESNRRGMVER